MEGSRGGDEHNEEEIYNDDLEETIASLSNRDVKKFLGSLSMDEAISLARECVLKVYEDELKRYEDEKQSSDADEEKSNPDFDFRSNIGMGGAVLRPSVPTAKILKL